MIPVEEIKRFAGWLSDTNIRATRWWDWRRRYNRRTASDLTNTVHVCERLDEIIKLLRGDSGHTIEWRIAVDDPGAPTPHKPDENDS